ncbi:MAG: hypothetical protein RMJ48_19055 [Roseiflexaceae bacterium]|nr:hypothetical protein [Roseiflexaceae bacterium]
MTVNEPARPTDTGLFGADRIACAAERAVDLIEGFWRSAGG